jgi:hypothetical protein
MVKIVLDRVAGRQMRHGDGEEPFRRRLAGSLQLGRFGEAV